MRVAVCIDQTLAPDAVVTLDRARRSVSVAAPTYTSNPTDDWAVAESIRLDGASHTGVFIVAAGQADPLLRSYLAAGSDEAIRVWDPALEEADDFTKARVLAAAAQRWSADVVMCGGRIGENEARLVGPVVAELLGLPQVTAVVRLKADGAALVAQRRVEAFVETVWCPLPAVVAIDRGRSLPYPTLPNRLRARTASIDVWDLPVLGMSAGSLPSLPIEVTAVSTPKPRRKTPVDSRPALDRTIDLLLGRLQGGAGSGGGDALLNGDDPRTAERVVARCLPILRTV